MNNIFEIKTRIEKLTEDINKRDDNYFLNENTGDDDHIYDGIFAELKRLIEENPQFDTLDSPIHRVSGGVSNTFDQVEHKIPMLSLGKAMSWDEFKKWFIDMVSKGVTNFVFELKYDGLACSILYIDGKFIRGCTRGDGKVGEDISITVNMVPNIPQTITTRDLIEVRGEVMLLKTGLDIINQDRVINGLKPYENVRNAASGVLRTKTPNKEIAKHLRFGPYMLAQFGDKSISHSQDLKDLAREGFVFASNIFQPFTINTVNKNNLDDTLKIVKEFFDKIQEARATLDFDIDGIVCKADLYSDQKRLGEKSKEPNWAIAFKFESEEKVTQLLGVDWLLGAKGNVTPRARITPTGIGGTTVTKPTLHNIEELKRLCIKIGDYVILQRRGDVIPKIDRVLFELRTGNETDIKIPTHCPECNEPLTFTKSFPRCDNKECPGRNLSRIRNYIISLEIEDFGPSLVEKLIEAEKISDIADIYNLVQSDIQNLDRMGEKSAIKVINNINTSKKAPLNKIISGLTIKNVGSSSGKDLATKYQKLSNFKKATLEELTSIDNMGPITAQNIIDWLENEDNQTIIDKLIDIGIGENGAIEIVKTSSTKLKGMKFGFTGDLDGYTRKEVEKVIIENGGISHGLKKDTDYILIGNGFKQHKVDTVIKKNPNVIIVKEEEFINLINS
jgi:DNA ligase (NAD+)